MACVYECVSHVKAHPGPTVAHKRGEGGGEPGQE